MKRSLIFVGASALLFLVAACDTAETGGVGVITEPPVAPVLDAFDLTYVSGHLGSYWDCPGDALPDPTAAAPAGERSGAWAGDCDGDGCGMMNCEHAEVTLQLRNTGETTIVGLELTSVVLKAHNGAAGTLASEVLEVTRSDGKPIGAAIAPGEELQIIVQFKGLPPNYDKSWFGVDAEVEALKPYTLNVDLHFSTPDTNETATTTDLQVLPAVAT